MGRGSSNGRPGTGGGGGSKAIQIPAQDSSSSYIRAINDNLATRQDFINNADVVLRQLAPGGRINLTFDYSDVSAIKQPDGRYQWNERGIRYNANGSYSTYSNQRTVGASVVKNALSDAARFYVTDSDGLISKQFSKKG